MKTLLGVIAGFVLVGLALVIIGSLLPREHVATRAAHYRQSPETIWNVITDVDAMPSWREGLKAVKRLPDRNGLPAHIEVTRSGEIPLETVEMSPPRRLVARIADPKLPFGGTWTFEIGPDGNGSVLRITERGWISNPIFRVLSRFVFGYTGTIETYLKSLARKFGETPQIEA